MARLLIKGWVRDGWLLVIEPARRSRAYGFSAIHRQCGRMIHTANLSGQARSNSAGERKMAQAPEKALEAGRLGRRKTRQEKGAAGEGL